MSCEMMNLAGLSEAEFRDGCTYLVRVMLVFIAAVSIEDGLGAWLRRGVMKSRWVRGADGRAQRARMPLWPLRAMVGLLWIITPGVASATSMTPDKVQSYLYAIGDLPTNSGVLEAVGKSPQDLFILSHGAGLPSLDRSIADPNNNKLIFSYIDVAEIMSFEYPSLFAGSTLPPWFGKQNPGYPGLYTVQYWSPEWEKVVFSMVDEIIAQGYDGIFLDVLNGDYEWSDGTPEGNPVYSGAVQAMATLVTDIRNYINS
jgi:hypothetical protein